MSDQPQHPDLEEVQHSIDEAKHAAEQLHHDAPNQLVENDQQVPEEGDSPPPG